MSVAIRAITRLQDGDDAPALGAGQDGYALTWDNASGAFVATALTAGVTDHGALTGLSDDDHTGYALLAGRSGGQTLYGGTDANGDITIHGTSNATRATSYVLLQPTAGYVGIGTSAPDTTLHVHAGSAGAVDAYPASVLALENSTNVYVNLLTTSGSAAGFVIGQGTTNDETFFTYNRILANNWDLTRNFVGGTFGYALVNTDNTNSSSSARVEVQVGGASAGDPMLLLTVPGATNWVVGIDNDYDDCLRIGSAPSPGSANALVITTTGLTGIGTAAPATLLHGLLTSAATDAVSNVVTVGHDTSGTAAAGFGAGLVFQLESSTTAALPAARIQALWNDATNATRKADLVLTAYDTAEREGLRIRGAGSAAAIGFYGVTPIERATLATGGGASVDDVITALQNLGLVKQS